MQALQLSRIFCRAKSALPIAKDIAVCLSHNEDSAEHPLKRPDHKKDSVLSVAYHPP